jgi:hypothetical protein
VFSKRAVRKNACLQITIGNYGVGRVRVDYVTSCE